MYPYVGEKNMKTFDENYIRSSVRLSYSIGLDKASRTLDIPKELICQWREEYYGFIDGIYRPYS